MTLDAFEPDNLRIRDDEIPTRRVKLSSVQSRSRRQFLPALSKRIFCLLGGLPGKAWMVYSVIAFRSRLEKSSTVELSTCVLKDFGLTRNVKWRALPHLARVGLIRVGRRPRKNPTITVLPPPEESCL
jgi:hypothetical protein